VFARHADGAGESPQGGLQAGFFGGQELRAILCAARLGLDFNDGQRQFARHALCVFGTADGNPGGQSMADGEDGQFHRKPFRV
jgi:hypothetical protein